MSLNDNLSSVTMPDAFADNLTVTLNSNNAKLEARFVFDKDLGNRSATGNDSRRTFN